MKGAGKPETELEGKFFRVFFSNQTMSSLKEKPYTLMFFI